VELIGHTRLIQYLNCVRQNNRLAHAFLFSGPESIGKKTTSLKFIKSFLCDSNGDKPCFICLSCSRVDALSHGNLLLIAKEKEKQNISIENMRTVHQFISLKSIDDKLRFIVIDDAHLMSEEAMNSLLKVLEEPPMGIIFILITSSINSLLQTIRSRCQILRFSRLSLAESSNLLKINDKFASEDLELLWKLCAGDMKLINYLFAENGLMLNSVKKSIHLINELDFAKLIDEELKSSQAAESRQKLKLLLYVLLIINIALLRNTGEITDKLVKFFDAASYINMLKQKDPFEILDNSDKILNAYIKIEMNVNIPLLCAETINKIN